jgi:hypothetical protein
MKKKLFIGMATLFGAIATFLPACDSQDVVTISDASINTAGELVLTYTDDTIQNMGIVKGSNGTDGVGITSAEINDKGELILNYSNGTYTNLGKITGDNGTDGTDGTDGKDGSKITIGQNGHLLIDGYDSYYLVGKKDTISIDTNGKKLSVGDTENITINNVSAVSAVDNIQSLENKAEHYYYAEPCKSSYNHESIYDDEGKLRIYRTCVRNVNDVYTFYESLIKGQDYPNNGAVFTIDTTDLTSINSNYSIYYNSGVKDNNQSGVQKGQATLFMSSVITFPDGREYDIAIQFDEFLSYEYFLGQGSLPTNNWYKNVLQDGKTFLTNSVVTVPEDMGYSGNSQERTTLGFKIEYIPTNADKSQTTNTEYYDFASVCITVNDSKSDTDYGKISQDESELVLGQVYELLKDRFVVYDIDYSVEKYNKG